MTFFILHLDRHGDSWALSTSSGVQDGANMVLWSGSTERCAMRWGLRDLGRERVLSPVFLSYCVFSRRLAFRGIAGISTYYPDHIRKTTAFPTTMVPDAETQ